MNNIYGVGSAQNVTRPILPVALMLLILICVAGSEVSTNLRI
jgi:hypothetical protein